MKAIHNYSTVDIVINTQDHFLLNLLTNIQHMHNSSSNLQLLAIDEQLYLIDKHKKQQIRINWADGKLLYRTKHRSKELLKKAFALTKSHKPQIIDTTAGLGKDAFLLASFGCKVIMCERNPVLACMLEYALHIYKQEHSIIKDIVQNIELRNIDANTYLAQVYKEHKPPCIQAIYLDPMFPKKTKTALVKKDMQILQQLLHETENCCNTTNKEHTRLLQQSLLLKPSRIVVKRPRIAPFLDNKFPEAQILGKSSRFDLYFPDQSMQLHA